MFDWRALLHRELDKRGSRGDHQRHMLPICKVAIKAGLSIDETLEAISQHPNWTDCGQGWEKLAGEIRKAYDKKTRQMPVVIFTGRQKRFVATYTPPPPPPQPKQDEIELVPSLMNDGLDVGDFDALRRLSPVAISGDTDEASRRVQCELMLHAMFAPPEMLFFRQSKIDNSKCTPRFNLRRLEHWLTDWQHLLNFAEIVRKNPLTGKEGKTADGRPSYGSMDCIAEYRHMLFEFDEMPLDDQCRFWAGFIRHPNFAKHLVCLTYSGGKSIHGIIDVDCGHNRELYNAMKAKFINLFASNPDRRYRLDVAALTPDKGTRLAGAIRRDTGKVQQLLYLRKGTRSNPQPPQPIPQHQQPPQPIQPQQHQQPQPEQSAAQPIPQPQPLPLPEQSAQPCDRNCAACEIERAAQCLPTFRRLWAETVARRNSRP